MAICGNCGTEVQAEDKFCRECGKSLITTTDKVDVLAYSPAPAVIEPTHTDSEQFSRVSDVPMQKLSDTAKLSPEEMVEFYKWRKSVKGDVPTISTPQPVLEIAKTTGEFLRSFAGLSNEVKQEFVKAMNPDKPTPTAALPQKVVEKPKLSPEEMVEFDKWRKLVKRESDQTPQS